MSNAVEISNYKTFTLSLSCSKKYAKHKKIASKFDLELISDAKFLIHNSRSLVLYWRRGRGAAMNNKFVLRKWNLVIYNVLDFH